MTKKIKEAVDAGAESMTLEVSSHGLVLGRLRGVEFDVAIFSNLTQDHLDFHGTMEAYGHAKSLLFSQLGEDLSKEKYIVLNNDDSFSEYLRTVTPYEVFSYGIDEEAQFMAKNIQESLQGVSFDFVTPFGTYPVKSPYVGKFNISNIMAAMIAVWSKGTSLETIIKAVENLEPVEGRLEVLDPSLPIDLIIDYAHTADGMNKLIDAVQPFVKQKLIFLVGMAGERDLTKTPEMGRVACRADYVIFTPDNPANDDPKMLTAELAKGATHQNYIEFDDRAEGIKHAIDIAEPGDTVVLASKGREPYQIMPGHIKVPHRDDLIGLEAAYKSSVVALLVNKRLIDEGKTIDVYLFEALNDQIIIAIPDWFWSYQMAMALDEETCFEAILMQLFVFKEEEEAESIASQLTDWIETYKKEKD